MSELQDIIKSYQALVRSGKRACFATVVRTSGSTYRRPGAHMLIPEEGATEGTISGGCLETDLVERAGSVMQSGIPTVVRYDSTSPTEIVLGLGLGCAGVVDVLLEPLPKGTGLDPLEVFSDCLRDRVGAAVATLYKVSGNLAEPTGGRYLLRTDGVNATDISDQEIADHIRGDCATLVSSGRSVTVSCQTSRGTAEAFVEVVRPARSLFICGAGPDAVPLVRCAKELGWRTIIVDSRTAYLHHDRFSLADERVFSQPGEIADHVSLTRDDAVVVMTHNYHQDWQLLRMLFSSPVRYIGLLGPRSKAAKLIEKLREEGVGPSEADLARLYNPVGLDIGAETPEEIALAIMSEIQAFVTGRTGSSLRSKPGPIHDQPIEASRS